MLPSPSNQKRTQRDHRCPAVMNGDNGGIYRGDSIVRNLCGLPLTALLSFVDGRAIGHEWLTDWGEETPWHGEALHQLVSLADRATRLHCSRAVVRKYYEVRRTPSPLRHPDDGSDVIGFFDAAMFVPLRRPSSCPSGAAEEGRACDDWNASPASAWLDRPSP
jgi:hypothetical protein